MTKPGFCNYQQYDEERNLTVRCARPPDHSGMHMMFSEAKFPAAPITDRKANEALYRGIRTVPTDPVEDKERRARIQERRSRSRRSRTKSS